MYLCVKGIDFDSLYDFGIWFWNCSDNVVFFVFILLQNIFNVDGTVILIYTVCCNINAFFSFDLFYGSYTRIQAVAKTMK
jgi:hypothetical protein